MSANQRTRRLPGAAVAFLAVVIALLVGAAGAPKPDRKAANETSAFDAGTTAVEKGDYRTALGHFEKAVAEEENSAESWNMLAYTQRKMGRLEDAFASYEKALSLKPRFAQAREYLGEAHLQAALEQVALLESYGAEGREAREELVAAIRAAAGRFSADGNTDARGGTW